jgi:hypothetical protein
VVLNFRQHAVRLEVCLEVPAFAATGYTHYSKTPHLAREWTSPGLNLPICASDLEYVYLFYSTKNCSLMSKSGGMNRDITSCLGVPGACRDVDLEPAIPSGSSRIRSSLGRSSESFFSLMVNLLRMAEPGPIT